MSKMHNITPSTRSVGFNSLSPFASPFQSISKLGYFNDQLDKFNPVKQPVEAGEHLCTDIKNQRYTSEEQNVRFSRFSAWHLTHMAENKQVQRSTQQNRALLDTFEDDSYQAERQDKLNYLTTGTYRLSDCAGKDFCSFNSSAQNAKTPKKQKIIKPKQTGLRKLSGKAFKIVKQLGEATYKEVASKLIESIMNDESSFDDEKEENNIKRRVYDALNVLIAMDILRKSGKNISYGQPSDRSKSSRREFLISIMAQKQHQIKKKTQKRERLIRQKKGLACLVSRNRNLAQSSDRIVIPMLCLQSGPMNKLDLSSDRALMKLKSRKQVRVNEGLDLIANLFADNLK